jgi:hypothetical protein
MEREDGKYDGPSSDNKQDRRSGGGSTSRTTGGAADPARMMLAPLEAGELRQQTVLVRVDRTSGRLLLNGAPPGKTIRGKR